MTAQHNPRVPVDTLGQQIQVDSIVAFSPAGSPAVQVGRVTRLTPKRIRIAYTCEWQNETDTHRWTGTYLARAAAVVVLNESTQQHITLSALQGLIP